MRRLAALYGGSAPHHRALTEPKYARWLAGAVYLPEAPDAGFEGYDGVLVPERLHAPTLARCRDRLAEVLARGGMVVLFGDQPVYGGQPAGWLPGVRWEHRPTNFWWWLEPGAPSPIAGHHPGHDLWRRTSVEAVTWHYHGVFEPPEGALTLISATEGGAVLYVDQASTPGTLVATALDPMSHFGSYFMPAAERCLDAFLPWLAEGDVSAAVPDAQGAVS